MRSTARASHPIWHGKPNSALVYAAVLFLLGILISAFTVPLCLAIALFNAFLLVAYAARLKSTPFFGNAAVSYLAASIFLFGGALAGGNRLLDMLPVATIAFLAMLARELLKDAEDIDGDRAGGADTLPIRMAYKRLPSSHLSLRLRPLRQACCPISGGGRGIFLGSPLSTSSSSLPRSVRSAARIPPDSKWPDRPAF